MVERLSPIHCHGSVAEFYRYNPVAGVQRGECLWFHRNVCERHQWIHTDQGHNHHRSH